MAVSAHAQSLCTWRRSRSVTRMQFSRSASCFSGCCYQIKGVRLLKIRAYTHKIHTEPFLKTMPSAQ
ncbi:hypothetical protein PHYPO_G00227220 [Pangasianodon hypophthalmus]|uniref:Uncharacterized protein n=1 Tax=Pangasianodon hypophthalmus TaxID=310915 RepID=A0A5N5NY64_PANHP|nr:hypothetical protein PHYPO_G00227220 [Pangasianodon hypophthalmus]